MGGVEPPLTAASTRDCRCDMMGLLLPTGPPELSWGLLLGRALTTGEAVGVRLLCGFPWFCVLELLV